MSFQTTILNEEEANTLVKLIGRPLNLIEFDRPCAVRIQASGMVLDFEPEEVLTPTRDHPDADICRPTVSVPKQEVQYRFIQVAKDLGVVSNVRIGTTEVTLTPSEWKEGESLLGAEIPAGRGYEMVFTHPKGCDATNDREIVKADLAILIETVEGHQVLIHTDGVAYFINLLVDGDLPEDFKDTLEWLPISARLKKSVK